MRVTRFVLLHFNCYIYFLLIFFIALQGHTGEVISLAFNSAGTHLVSGSFDHTVIMWDVASGK